MPLGGNEVPKIVEALKRAAPFLRRQVGASSTMRYMPALSFIADETYEEGAKIDALLRSAEISRDLSAVDADDEGDESS